MKKSIYNILAIFIFIGLFNLIFFMTNGTNNPAGVWISYGMIQFAYLLIFVMPLLNTKSKSEYINKTVIQMITAIYFIIELVIGIIFIVQASEDFMVALITQIVIFAIYFVIALINLSVNEKIAEHEEQ